jgi:acetolactate synthase-1/2/3 large subunit
MKVSEAIAKFISEIGTKKVFGVSGGASLHLLAAVSSHKDIELVCLHHEQSVAMAADAYFRLQGQVGIGIVTSGPGATNLITGIAGAYYDSIPCIFLTGQVSLNRSKGLSGVRQRGFQETPIVEIVREITKYAISVKSPEEVIPALHEAYKTAISGRMGPVLVDIPDDIQRMDILDPRPVSLLDRLDLTEADTDKTYILFEKILRASKKPIVVLGSGLRIGEIKVQMMELLQDFCVPVVTTWGAKDMVADSNPSLLGTFGTHGSRFANYFINEADLIISIGSRLDLKATGSPLKSFAPNAKKVMFDIDIAELNKFDDSELHIDLPICVDLNSEFILTCMALVNSFGERFQDWRLEIDTVRSSFPREERTFLAPGVNPYLFIESLSEVAPENLDLIVDTGCAIAWTMQSWRVKLGQCIIHDFNNTAMGWSIPATIASLDGDASRISYCVIGDGSIMMTLGELANVRDTGRKVVIFLLNNNGYAMIKQTQDQWFLGNYFASDSVRDLRFPDFRSIAQSFGFNYLLIEDQPNANNFLTKINELPGVVFCEIKIQHDARVVPIAKFGNPNHVMDPSLN